MAHGSSSIFQGDDAGYLEWIDRHADGYVVNIHTLGRNRSMLHTARCGFMYPPNPERTHTIAYGKAFSLDDQALSIWASEHGHTLAECSFCKPKSAR